jgi:hypothetical protein
MNWTRSILAAFPLAALAGCTSDEFARLDGVTPGAGAAIRANTAMQIVGPQDRGRTVLLVPAVRLATSKAEAADDGAADSKTTSP